MLTSLTTLLPGGFYFTDKNERIQTLLGSCVAITLWHPKRFCGGMCHFQLPSRKETGVNKLDGRYADEAMQLFMHEINRRGIRPQEFLANIYGAGNMFGNDSTCENNNLSNNQLCDGCLYVSCRNRYTAIQNVLKVGFKVLEVNLGGKYYRHVEFHVADGRTLLKKTKVMELTPKTRM